MIINMFLVCTEEYRNAIMEYLAWDTEEQGEYDGILEATDEAIFGTMADAVIVQNIFNTDTARGKTWYMFSLHIQEPQVDDVVDWLADNRTNQFEIMGAWEFDAGIQYGTEIEPEDGSIKGDPTFPISTRLIKFMPDIVEYDENGDVVSTTPATALTDVNKIQGQANRRFT